MLAGCGIEGQSGSGPNVDLLVPIFPSKSTFGANRRGAHR
ncbi:hypothetical protein OEM_48970 [Mycobacterium intracellulare subsp. yongonense 05-1390]|uniref:Uncharacterized protein n=2 Tax=Mycobacterium intracellulare TaxID=1767 RepID=X8CE85_MYCIT|nr:P40 protein [Mycobacterium intracellulare subsp. intracellulare MTCC 9506]AGP66432.1 hypothetical protein OEM_48970 [Mycobacterium intracellulare subsp. yongonense 05-1390]ETZ30751.1 hypothetical protein L843_5214 [Mycobacterium intracellulare MIN_061107_1834]EUA29109.1 hypothetical protein I548_2296 [Mycobacterium intracellulare]EUA53738.1 hypothetical protein I550_5376 [Mycobacterium intracellulare 1956]